MAASAYATSDSLYYSHASVGPAASITDYPFTLACWCRLDSISGSTDSVIALTDASGSGSGTNWWQINDRDMSGNVGFRIRSETSDGTDDTTDYDTGQTFGDGHWFHVVATFRSSTDRELYIDGVSRATATATATFSQPDTVGWSIGNSGKVLTGAVTHISLYDAGLSVDEVNNIMYDPLSIPKNLIWCIPCQQTAYGSTASNYKDVSGNGWNCTAAGSCAADDDGPPIYAPQQL